MFVPENRQKLFPNDKEFDYDLPGQFELIHQMPRTHDYDDDDDDDFKEWISLYELISSPRVVV